MYFAPLEGGLAVTSATGNRVVLRNKKEHHVWMAAGYTPLAAGPDNVIYLVPDSSEDGASKSVQVSFQNPSASFGLKVIAIVFYEKQWIIDTSSCQLQNIK